MALIAGTPWGSVARPWGWEVRVDFTDSETGRIHNAELSYPGQAMAPSAVQIAADVEVCRLSLAERIAAEAAPESAGYTVTCEDGTEVSV